MLDFRPDIGVQGQTTGESAYVMVMPLRAGETEPGGAQPLPPRLHILHAYTRLKMSNSKESMVVRNMSESLTFLKMGVQPLPSVALRPTVCGLSSGEGTSSFSNKDVH